MITLRKGALSALLPGAIALSLVVSACSSMTPTGTPAAVATSVSGAVDSAPAKTAVAQSAPTVAAVATQVAPSAQAAATQVAGGAVPTALAAIPVRVTDVKMGTNDVMISVHNAGTQPIDLTGFKLRLGTATLALPGTAVLKPNDTITIHTGKGTDGPGDIYIGQDLTAVASALASNPTVAVLGPSGQVVAQAAMPQAVSGR